MSVDGVNVVGFFRAEFGQGEAARAIVAGLEHGGVPVSTLTLDDVPHRQDHPFTERSAAGAPFSTTILCLNAEHVQRFALREEHDATVDTYRIAVWFWEASIFPAELHSALDHVDEIWVASDYVAGILRRVTSKPIHVFPLPVGVAPIEPMPRTKLGLPDNRFAFLFVFDYFSTVERKNPIALIEAFKLAFAPDEGPVLVLKSINGSRLSSDRGRVQAAAADRPDIILLDNYVPAQQRDAMIATCDCYVSLHASEGFGLTMAEAMTHARPVIATGYSGNLMFMDAENSFLVDYTVTKVPENRGPYPAGAEWAAPEIDDAARLMRLVVAEPETARLHAERGRSTVVERHSAAALAAFLTRRLGEIEPERDRAKERHVVLTPAQLAARYLKEGPTLSWSTSSRRGPLGRFGRLAIRRVLRPYLVRQRELESALVGAAAQSEARLDELTRSLEQRDRRIGESLDRAVSSVDHLEAALHARPYLAEPGRFWRVDSEGNRQLGFMATTGSGVQEPSPYAAFEAIFRGPESRIRDHQRAYLPLLEDAAPVLDLGCGRGEFLDLMAEAGIEARGVDLDPGMVARCREKGHNVELQDALDALEEVANASLGAVFASHVIEHLSADELDRLILAAGRKLRSGGQLVTETVNPHSISGFKTFWTDRTHNAPVFPEVAVGLAAIHGFSYARVVFPWGTGNLDQDLVSETEYALVATR